MKKLLALAVVFAFLVPAVFAADLGAEVFGGIIVLHGDNNKVSDGATPTPKEKATDLMAGGSMTRLRLSGSGGNDTFGAWYRMDLAPFDGETAKDRRDLAIVQGKAWWQPIEQFKLTIGGDNDGMYGKEGWAGWMFYQLPSEVGIVQPEDCWGGGYWARSRADKFFRFADEVFDTSLNNWYEVSGTNNYRNAFFGGWAGDGLILDIMPADIFGLTIGLPFFDGLGIREKNNSTGKELKAVFDNVMIQANLNLDFGNIAITFWNGAGDAYGATNKDGDDINPAKLYLSTSISAIDNVGIDFSVGFPLPVTDETDYGAGLGGVVKSTYQAPIAIGLGAKIGINDSFGIKTRLLVEMGEKYSTDVSGDKPVNGNTFLALELHPYYAISDELVIHCGLGFNMISWNDQKDVGYRAPAQWDGKTADDVRASDFGWFFNPYVQVGAEWGPTFYAGVRLWSATYERALSFQSGTGDPKGYTPLMIEIPMGLVCSF